VETAARVASVPPTSSAPKARALVSGNPLSFLRRVRDRLPTGTIADGRVYGLGVRSFEDLKRAAPLVIEDARRCTLQAAHGIA
jgi:hypothetical protein